MSSKKPLKLFRVLSTGGKVEGEFGSKQAAKRFRDELNASKPSPWAWVSVGPDHWRWNTDRTIPQRPHIDAKPWIDTPEEEAVETKAPIMQEAA